ncbi:hypothetical protein [Haliangium sp.]|uniref:hypothetical protein n=1 Tax=Haliangium sp. TaxID=2663208 RepID=UPI003D117AAD
MHNSHVAAATFVTMSLVALALASPTNADEPDGTETCASKYPNAPTQPPRGYDYDNESDAYMAFRRAAMAAGYTSVKKAKRDDVQSGPCMGHGEHLNMKGRRRASKGKSPEWTQVGSMSSCDLCEETPRGPRLYKTVWRIHPDF